ncbi:MAG: hypothetical protein AAB424_02710 [Patescibacteria group bacterium]
MKRILTAAIVLLAILLVGSIAILLQGCNSDNQSTAPVSNSQTISKTVTILQNNDPSDSDIAWVDGLTSEQLDSVFAWMSANLPIDSARMKSLDAHRATVPMAASSCGGEWRGEWIEMQSGGGRGCYSDGFTNDWDKRCGADWPPDKVYFFPCANQGGKSAMRIYSTDWRSRIALRSGSSARVYPECTQICVGYWSLYFSSANPYTLMHSTYIYW